MRVPVLLVTATLACFAQQIKSLSIGGSGLDQPYAVRTDAEGNTIVAGTTLSGDFPATAIIGKPASQDKSKVFVIKLGREGDIRFSVVLGGSSSDVARGMTTDSAGNIYVTGWTTSEDFPVTSNALQPQMKTSAALDPGWYRMDVFVLKVSGNGELLYST